MKDIVKCPSCNANVEITDDQQRAFCSHCGSKAFEREEVLSKEELKKQIEDAMNFGNEMAAQGMQGSLDMTNDYLAEMDNIIGDSFGGLFNLFEKKPKEPKVDTKVYLYSKKDKPVKDKELDKWVKAKAHLFVNATNDTINTYGHEVKKLVLNGNFVEAYGYIKNIATVPIFGGLYIVVLGILKSVFYAKPHNDFCELAESLAIFNDELSKYQKNAGLNDEQFAVSKIAFCGMNIRYMCWIAVKLFQEYNKADRKDSWFKETFLRLFHFMEIIFISTPIENFKDNTEIKETYAIMIKSYSPVLIRLSDLVKNDIITLAKLNRIQKLIDSQTKELGI